MQFSWTLDQHAMRGDKIEMLQESGNFTAQRLHW